MEASYNTSFSSISFFFMLALGEKQYLFKHAPLASVRMKENFPTLHRSS